MTRVYGTEKHDLAVQDYCRRTASRCGDYRRDAAVIYNSLAKCYADTLAQLERMTGNITILSM